MPNAARIDSDTIITPTPERTRRGPIEQLERPIIYDGSYTPPRIAVDILGSLLRRKTITGDEWLAGYRFRAWFRLAEDDQLRAADMGRVIVDGGRRMPKLNGKAEDAKCERDKAIRYVGGMGSSSGSCLWHVIGLEHSLRRWVREQRKASEEALNRARAYAKTQHADAALARTLNQAAATGVLIVALENLARMPWIGPYERTS